MFFDKILLNPEIWDGPNFPLLRPIKILTKLCPA